METYIDDVGSFPLPPHIDVKAFNEAYTLARKAIIDQKDLMENSFLVNNFFEVVVNSFKKKAEAGLDVITYPQHYNMINQLADVVHDAMTEGTYLVEEKNAILPELHVLRQQAKELCEELGDKLQLRVCILGPMELYLKEVGIVGYEDVLQTLADTVKRFVENSILDSKYIKTAVVSLDEPSFGYQDISIGRDSLLDILERAFSFSGPTKQIHLHSPSKIVDLLNVDNLDVLSIEYAASPKNIDSVSKRMLEQSDKHVRVGVSRTDINSIFSELIDKGITKPTNEQIVDSEEVIKKRFVSAKEKYGERMIFTGPDCGLGGWPSQNAAVLLLQRTVNAVKGS